MTPLTTLADWFSNAPLYAKYQCEAAIDELGFLYGPMEGKLIFDGFCPFCHQHSTFNLPRRSYHPDTWANITKLCTFGQCTIVCARSQDHIVRFWYLIQNSVIEKVGQFPSLADIANDESRLFKTQLGKINASEFHKAIGLAAHGVGIGSFVYLRRIFERLVIGRFNEFKELEGWSDELFPNRMVERITFLKDHLPSFLVENSRIYSILSLGIHELSEEKCLAIFPVLRHSIIIILEEDKKKQEEIKRREEFAKAIANFDAAK